MMEHRLARRQPVSLPAVMHDDAGGRKTAVRIVNFSHGGAFLEVARRGLNTRGLIALEFVLPGTDNERRYRWPAFVIHAQADGLGVMFDELKFGEAELVITTCRSAVATDR